MVGHDGHWPPGYRAPARVAPGRDVLEIIGFAVGWLLGADQLLMVQPTLYRQTSVGPSASAVQVALLSVGSMGWLTAARPTAGGWRSARRGTLDLLASSLMIVTAGIAHPLAFTRGTWACWCSLLPSIGGAWFLGRALRHVPSKWTRSISSDVLIRTILRPWVVVSAVALLVVSAAVSNSVGGVRASIATAAVLTTAAVLSELRDVASIPVVAVSFAWLLGCAALAITTGARLPLRVLLDSSLPVVAFERCDRCSMTVTQGQGGYHLFVDGELRFSSIDERRWAEALTRSALARLKQPKRALVLSTGEGLIERELLADSGIESITSVVRCRLAADAARSSAWLRALTRDSMRSERVLLLEHDPAAFIAIQDGRTYDLVVVDLPDPANPILSKYYSRYFYRRLADRLNPGGVLVVQATSARRSPRTFATIGATLQAAGFSVLPQFVPLISRGEWGLYLASKSTIPSVLRPRWIETSLAGTISAQFDNAWPDTLPPQDFHAEPSTLDDAKVLDWFELESAGHRE